VKYFNSLEVWKIEPVGAGARPRGDDEPPPPDEPPAGWSDEEVPF